MKYLEILQDLDISRGIIVCESGFTNNTLIYAKHR